MRALCCEGALGSPGSLMQRMEEVLLFLLGLVFVPEPPQRVWSDVWVLQHPVKVGAGSDMLVPHCPWSTSHRALGLPPGCCPLYLCMYFQTREEGFQW